jgi:putative transposase
MQDSHTPVAADETTTDPDRLRLVDTATLGLAERLAGRLDGHLARFAEHLREGLLAASAAVGLEVMAELMDTEVTDLAGPKGKHNPARVAKRHGGQDGTVTLGGRRVPVRRPRVRTVGDDEHELTLESYETFTSADLLADGVVARMLGGLSTRGYPVGLEPVGARVEQIAVGTSRSAVSRRFVAATAERLDQLQHRPLGEQRWLVVFLDGFGMGEHLLVGALGVTADGTKVPLGVVEGTTENTAVGTRLVTGLRDRGLDADRGVLFVIDGGKALGAAVRAVFGAKALVQRCRRHKERNVTDHLPEAERPLVQRRLRSAWATPDPDQAQHELEALARSLARQRPGAAASLREGLAET